MANIRIWRSLLFIPANNWKMLNKAATEIQDGVLIDLEDSCPMTEKETGRIFARDIAPHLKNKGHDVLVRVNSLQNSGLILDDINTIAVDSIDGIMLPKSESKKDIKDVSNLLDKIEKERKLTKKIVLLPLLESPKGIINAKDIATASDRVIGLGFGAADYMREMGAGFAITNMTAEEYAQYLQHPRAEISTIAAALGILAIDTPFFGLLTDTDGLDREAKRVKLMGFKGKMATHPSQLDVINRVFSPSDKEIMMSDRIINAYKKAEAEGKGAVTLDGKMIDVAMYKMATEMKAITELIDRRKMSY